MGQARASDIKDKHIPTATDELDAIVEATAAATGSIMDACEVIESIAELPPVAAEQVTKIYEACSFQDITGQRITKVVKTLKTIEQKVEALIGILGEDQAGSGHSVPAEEETRVGDAALLNGPQMAGQAITQEEIDKLLGDFD